MGIGETDAEGSEEGASRERGNSAAAGVVGRGGRRLERGDPGDREAGDGEGVPRALRRVVEGAIGRKRFGTLTEPETES